MSIETSDTEAARIEKVIRKHVTETYHLLDRSEWENDFTSRLPNFSWLSEEEVATITEQLEGIEEAQDVDAFTTHVLRAFKPVVTYIKANPREYQKEQQGDAYLTENGDRLNELLHYHIGADNNMHLHVFPNMFTSQGEQLRLLREGLQLAAEKLRDDTTVQKVYATSWIVTENPRLLEMLGFTVEGPITKEEQEQLFGGEHRVVSRASIPREEFIDKHST